MTKLKKPVSNLLDKLVAILDVVENRNATYDDYRKIAWKFNSFIDDLDRHMRKRANDSNYELDICKEDLSNLADNVSRVCLNLVHQVDYAKYIRELNMNTDLINNLPEFLNKKGLLTVTARQFLRLAGVLHYQTLVLTILETTKAQREKINREKHEQEYPELGKMLYSTLQELARDGL